MVYDIQNHCHVGYSSACIPCKRSPWLLFSAVSVKYLCLDIEQLIYLAPKQLVKEKLSHRISNLLDVPVSANDGLSQYICEKCK